MSNKLTFFGYLNELIKQVVLPVGVRCEERRFGVQTLSLIWCALIVNTGSYIRVRIVYSS